MAAEPNHPAFLPAAVVDLNVGSESDSGSNTDVEIGLRACRDSADLLTATEAAEQETRAQRRRYLNRLASERSRQKRKKKSDETMQELQRLEKRNVELRRIADTLTGRLRAADRLLRIVSSGGIGDGVQSVSAIDADSASAQKSSPMEAAASADGAVLCQGGLSKVPAGSALRGEPPSGRRNVPY